MTKLQLIEQLARAADLELGAARRAVTLLFGTQLGTGLIADALERGDKITLAGFGSFQLRRRPARLVRDVNSGVPRELPARLVPVFKPGAALKDRFR